METNPKPKRRTRWGSMLAIILVVVVIVGLAQKPSRAPSSAASPASSQTPPPAKTAAQLAAEKAESNAVTRTVSGALALQSSMRNPDSFRLSAALFVPLTGAICYEYRAQNGFGGMNVEHAILSAKDQFYDGSRDYIEEAWRGACAERKSIDYAPRIAAALSQK